MPEARIEEKGLNAIGRDRLENGVLCAVYFERFEKLSPKFAAVCVDFGLHARGDSATEARENLESVIHAFIDLARESGNLEAVLNRPTNSAALDHLHRVQRASQIATKTLQFCAKWLSFFVPPAAEEYREAVGSGNAPAFA